MAPKSKLATLKADLERATNETRTEAATLAKRHEALTRERETPRCALSPAAECLAAVDRLVDEEHARRIRELGVEIASDLSGRFVSNPGSTREFFRGPLLPHVADKQEGLLTLEDLCLLVPDLVKAGLKRVVNEAGASHGLAAEARAKRIAEIDAELATIESQHEELREAARTAGIELPEIEAVRLRREAEEAKERAQFVPYVRGAVGGGAV